MQKQLETNVQQTPDVKLNEIKLKLDEIEGKLNTMQQAHDYIAPENKVEVAQNVLPEQINNEQQEETEEDEGPGLISSGLFLG